MKEKKAIKKVLEIADTYDDLQKRIKKLKQCVKEGHKSGDIIMVGVAYCCLAEAYSDAEDLRGMLVNSLKAVTILQDTEEYVSLVNAYAVLGHAYTNQGNNQMALDCDEFAYRLVKKHRIQGQPRITALNNLSVSYHVMEEPKKSIRYLNECIDLLKQDYSEDYTDLVMYSINLAGCHKDIGELDRAEEIFDSISELLEKVAFKPLVCDYYLRRAIVSYLREDKAAGNGYMDTAFSIFPENIYPLPLYDDLCEVARMISKGKDRARSEKIFNLMTIYAEKNAGTLEQLFATRMMAHYYKDFGEYQLASEYFAKYEKLNEKQLREIKEMQMKLHNTSRNTEAEIRRLKRKMRANEELASLEPMTKLLNRSALLKVSSEFIGLAAKRKQKIGAVFIDIDYFKECNDTYGHAKGDEIIQNIARVCRKEETPNVRFARYGGDEFFGLTRGLSDEEICNIARRVCRTIREENIPHHKNPNGGRITLSVGIANVPITDRTDSILEIANYADKALYHAKNAGRNAIYKLDYGNIDEKEKGGIFVKIDF